MKDGNFWIAAGALLLTALSLVLNFFIERFRAAKQLQLKEYETEQNRRLKEYEVEFMEKRKSFVELFGAFRSLFLLARTRRKLNPLAEEPSTSQVEHLKDAFDRETTAFYALMPFLPASDHAWFEEQTLEIEDVLREIWVGRQPELIKVSDETYRLKARVLRKELFNKLFDASGELGSERVRRQPLKAANGCQP